MGLIRNHRGKILRKPISTCKHWALVRFNQTNKCSKVYKRSKLGKYLIFKPLKRKCNNYTGYNTETTKNYTKFVINT